MTLGPFLLGQPVVDLMVSGSRAGDYMHYLPFIGRQLLDSVPWLLSVLAFSLLYYGAWNCNVPWRQRSGRRRHCCSVVRAGERASPCISRRLAHTRWSTAHLPAFRFSAVGVCGLVDHSVRCCSDCHAVVLESRCLGAGARLPGAISSARCGCCCCGQKRSSAVR